MENAFKIKKGLIVTASGSTAVDIQGNSGQLFSITDSLTGVLMSVNDISGLPILEVSSDDTVKMGTFGAEGLIVSGSSLVFPNVPNAVGDLATITANGTISRRTVSQLLSDMGAQPALTNPITGTGTTNFLSKFTGASTLGNSLVFDNGTNVGIGTTSPTQKLEVIGPDASSATIKWQNANRKAGYLYSDGGGAGIFVNSLANTGIYFFDSSRIDFRVGGSERMRITSAGNVGIGTTSPSSLLHLQQSNVPRITLLKTGIISWFIGNPAQSTSNNFSIGTDSGGNTNILTLANTGDVRINHTNDFSATFSVNKVGGRVTANFSNGVDADVLITTSDTAAAVKFARITPSVSGLPIQLGVNNNNVLINTTTDSGFKLDVNGTGIVRGQLTSQVSNTAGDGGIVFIKNSASSTLGNAAVLAFATDAGGTITNNPRIQAISTNAGNGASSLEFFVHAGAAVVNKALTLSSTQAATFSSSVTATSFIGPLTGNATTATTLQTARLIGGVSFNGSANINLPGVNAAGNQNTTGSAATLTTARTLTIGATGKSFNGGANVAWSLAEIGALPLAGGTLTGPLEISTGAVNNAFNEGLRITAANNGWAGITLGSTGLSGAPTNGWFLAKNPSNQIIISPGGSANTTGLQLNSGGNALWRNNIIFHDGYHPNADTLTTARTLTIGSTGKTFNGSANVAWSLAEIGAYAATNPSGYITSSGSISGNAATATFATSAGSAPNAGNVNPFYNVTAGDGNGLRFWGSDSYKISMGVGSLYQYGTVTDYSIKTQMNAGSPGRGFTWGRKDIVPIASLNATSGNMQIAGTFAASNFSGTHSGTSSGTNTGDQTNISGNAATATALTSMNISQFSNNSGYITGINSGNVTTALGFTPYNATNPNGYITSSALSGYATETYVNTAVSNLVSAAPATLDTLNELAAALGDDPNFATTVTNSIATKAPLTGGGASGTWGINVTGNATTATTLQNARTINGTSFNGSANITTANWGTARDINGTSVNGSGNVAIGRIYDTNFRRITNPGGGEFVTQTATVTGAIEIVFPNAAAFGMYRLVIKVYEYTTNESFEVHAGGHTSSGNWHNPFAYIIGNPTNDRRFTVRFGRNAANKAVVYIGETGSTWSYPQVYLTEFTNGYASFENNSTGWAINFRTAAFENVTRTISNCQVGYAVSTNTANSNVLRDGSGNFSAGTITATLSGNASTATTLQTARTIGGVSFNGSANINLPGVNTTGNQNTTGSAATLTTARTLTIGNTGKSFNGAANVAWSLAEIGAQAAGSYAAASHTHTIANVTGLQTALDGKQAAGSYSLTSHTHADATTSVAGFMSATDKTKLNGIASGANNYSLPEATSTVRGGIELFNNTDQAVAANAVTATAGRTYGIQLNAAGQAVVNVPWVDTNTTHSVGNGGLTEINFTAALNTKLAGIAAGATNVTNTNQLTNGAGYITSSHTHVIADVTGLQTALDGKAASSHTHTIANVTGLQTALDSKQASGSYLTTSGKAADSNLLDGLDLHTGRNNEVNKVVRTQGNGYVDFGWINTTSGNTTSTITDIYVNTNDGYIRKATPAHFRSQITDGVYAPVSHTHTIANVTGLQTALDGKAASSHTHTIANVTGLQTALNGKQVAGSYAAAAHDHDRLFLTDSRGAARLPSYYDDRYAQWDFQNSADTGAGGDSWHGLLTVAKWVVYDATHRQEQLAFTGNDLKRRTATSDSAWGAWKTIIDSGNVGSQSVSHASTAGSATTAVTADSANFLNRYSLLTSQDWNGWFFNAKMLVSSVSGHSGANRPVGTYEYGSTLSYGASGEDSFQMYFPENSINSGANARKLHYRSGWNGTWSSWKTVVDMVGDTCALSFGTSAKLKIQGSSGYGSPSNASVELLGDADGHQTRGYRFKTDAADWNGQDLRIERYGDNFGYQLVGRIPKNTLNLEWQGTIVQGLSDARVKTNVSNMTDGIDKINQIRPVTFDWIPTENVSDRDDSDFGFIAQELEEILPEAVHTRGDGYKTVSYEKVVPVLVQAMKEQQAMIEYLKAEIELLKNK
jgi:hypothetical protein